MNEYILYLSIIIKIYLVENRPVEAEKCGIGAGKQADPRVQGADASPGGAGGGVHLQHVRHLSYCIVLFDHKQ
jgi:hypothetical protein